MTPGQESLAPATLNTADIVAFADTVDLDLVRAPLLRQLELNLAIADYGMREGCGAIGTSARGRVHTPPL